MPWREAQEAGLICVPLRKPHDNAGDRHWRERGTFTEVDHPSRIVMTWGWESHPELAAPGSSIVTVDLTEHGGGTLVRLTHTGLAGPAITGHSDGWDKYMPRLAIAAAGGDPGPDPDPTKED